MPPKPAAAKGAKPGTPKGAKPGGAAKKGGKKGEEKTAEEIEQDRVLRNSIDHEAKIRDQIAALTGKVDSFCDTATCLDASSCAYERVPPPPPITPRPHQN